ncbi:hypothetical protein [Glaciihabitans sp. dw_435]|uniref:hypothetical protein n=1 Tax=Glaciihabitans sp. dw_435 TaxID=2720081 RepID=UPI001BD65EFB|nr:hypothetical protein [Glaciihabitans sp. dw_435]
MGSTVMPVIVLTPPEANPQLITTLQELGWASHGTLTHSPGQHLTINDRVVRLTHNDTVLFQHPIGNAWAPVGWWKAVTSLDNQCVIVVVASTHINLNGRSLHAQLDALTGSHQTVTALVPVTH